jgi:hypothetical protein
MCSINRLNRITASRHRGGDAADADRIRAGPGLGMVVRRRSPEPLDTDRRQRHHRCGGGARNSRTDVRANAESTGLRSHSEPRIILEQTDKLPAEFSVSVASVEEIGLIVPRIKDPFS